MLDISASSDAQEGARLRLEALGELSAMAMSTSKAHLAELVSGIEQAGVQNIGAYSNIASLAADYDSSQVDAIMLDIDANGLGAVEAVLDFAAKADSPIALFLDSGIDTHLGKIIDAGICTVVVDGLAARRIPHLLETTIHRFRKMRGLQIQLEEALSALEQRKLVDRAKGLLMAQRGISEPEAYKLLRQAAMNKNCKISDIAQTIIIANEV